MARTVKPRRSFAEHSKAGFGHLNEFKAVVTDPETQAKKRHQRRGVS